MKNICAYVTRRAGGLADDVLKGQLIKHVRTSISPIANPDFVQWAPTLPKKRPGKIVRRILRKVAEGNMTNLGDASKMADLAVVAERLEARGLPPLSQSH
jgi:acetyl-CoA synthetase